MSYDKVFKLMVVGDAGVGKRTLLSAYTHDSTPKDPNPTTGFNNYMINLITGDIGEVGLQIWDIRL